MPKSKKKIPDSGSTGDLILPDLRFCMGTIDPDSCGSQIQCIKTSRHNPMDLGPRMALTVARTCLSILDLFQIQFTASVDHDSSRIVLLMDLLGGS